MIQISNANKELEEPGQIMRTWVDDQGELRMERVEAIYIGEVLIWGEDTGAASCYGSGFWRNDLFWTNDDFWRNE